MPNRLGPWVVFGILLLLFGVPVAALAEGETREVVLQEPTPRDPAGEILVSPQIPEFCPPLHPKYVRLVLPGGVIKEPEQREFRSFTETYRFAGLAPGTYRVEINDPRFEPWSTNETQPGPVPIRPKLVGSSAIELTVLDAVTRQPIERFAFELVKHSSTYEGHSMSASGDTTLEEKHKLVHHPGGTTRLTGLVAGTLRYVLAAEGFEKRSIDVELLRPGETRQLSIELHPGVPLIGTVRRAGDGAPIAGALVVLFAPAHVEDHPDAQLLPFHMGTRDEHKRRREIARCTSDSRGRFRLKKIQSGTWILTATKVSASEELALPMQLTAPCIKLEGVRVDTATPPAPIDLFLPHGASLSGKAVLPDGADTNGIAIVLRRMDVSEAVRADPFVKREVGPCPIASDGTYRFDVLAAGEYEASFALPIEPPDDLNFSKRLLEALSIPDGGAVRRDFDLRSLFPARVDARLEFVSGIAESCQLYFLEPVDGNPSRGWHWSFQRIRFDEQGSASHRWVHPGRKDVFAVGGEGRWVHVLARNLEIAPNSHRDFTGQVVLLEGDVEVARYDGELLAGGIIGLCPLLDPPLHLGRYVGELRLDDRGRARLALPAGRYWFGASHPSDPKGQIFAEVAWTGGKLLRVVLQEAR